MTDPTGSTAPVEPPATEPPTVTPPAAPEPPAAATPPAKKSLEDSLSGVDDETRTHILGELAKARKAAGDARVEAKTKAAEEARTELAQTIGKALGLVKDDEVADPAKLTEQLTIASSDARQAKLELAVFRAAPEAKADALALLDSRTAMAELADVDPTDQAAVLAAITAAVTKNPGLVQADPRRIPNPNPAQGTSGFGGAPTLDDLYAAAVKSGDVKEQIRIQNQKLAALPR